MGRKISQCLNIVPEAAETDNEEGSTDRQKISGRGERSTLEDLLLTRERSGDFTLNLTKNERFENSKQHKNGGTERGGETREKEENTGSEDSWKKDVELAGIEDVGFRNEALEM